MQSRRKVSASRIKATSTPTETQPQPPTNGDDYPTLNVLLFALGQRSVYRPILYSRNEVFCGPDCNNEVLPDGRIRTLRMPVGTYDASSLSKIAGWRTPDLLVVKADATGRNFPRGLGHFKCTKVLVVGNTQHLDAPIQRLLRYAKDEDFDYVTSDHKRHHLHYFVEAGFGRVAWMPGLNVYPHPQPEHPTKVPQVVFVGQTGKFHPFRNKVLATLRRSGVPILISSVPQKAAAALYADSLIALNCSLNGDLNLRVFEVLSSGGFLLTDRLAPEAGLELLFKEGDEYEAWATTDELLAKVDHYLQRPEEARAIARRGADAFWRRHTPQAKAKEFVRWATGGGLPDEYEMARDPRVVAVPAQGMQALLARVQVYERVQELQLQREKALVLVDPAVDWRVLVDLADLPRIDATVRADKSTMPSETLAAWQRSGVLDRIHWQEPKPSGKAEFLWDMLILPGHPQEGAVTQALLDTPALSLAIHPNPRPDDASLPRDLVNLGFLPTAPGTYACKRPNIYGEYLLNKGRRASAVALLQAAVDHLPEDPDWLTDTGLLAASLGQTELAELAFRSAIARRPTHGRARALLATLLRQTSRTAEAVKLDEALDIFPRGTGVEPEGPLISAKRVLVVNNLFPPQELGGYGRLLADFADLLRRRGHSVEVLTSDTPYLGPVPEHEPWVERSLKLFGSWQAGKTTAGSPSLTQDCVTHNLGAVANKIRRFQPNICLLGNIDYVGSPIINELLNAGVPVLHHVGNSSPGYAPKDAPTDPRYRLAAASVWLARKIAAAGFPFSRVDVIYPGALVTEYYRAELPKQDLLRIGYASIVLPYKGPQVLLAALAQLREAGVPFSCTIAGTSTDPAYVSSLKEGCSRSGLDGQVAFAGFLDRSSLKELFATHNVLAFPSQFDEPFGISQVEAMASGLIVVSSGTGGAAEIVEDEVSGLIAPPREPAAFAQAFASLPQDTVRWQRLAREGQKRALALFDIRRSVDQIEATFEQLLGG